MVIYKRLVDRERGDEETSCFYVLNTLIQIDLGRVKPATLGMMNGDNSAVFYF